MNKELTPLEALEELRSFLSMSFEFNEVDKLFVNGSFNIIEKELEAIWLLSDIIHLSLFEFANEYWLNIEVNKPDEYDYYVIKKKITKELYDLLKEVLV